MIHSRLRLVLSAAHRPDGYGIRTEDVKSPPLPPTRRSNATRPLSAALWVWLMRRPARPANPSRTAPYTTGTAQGGGGRRRRPGGVSGGSREPGGTRAMADAGGVEACRLYSVYKFK